MEKKKTTKVLVVPDCHLKIDILMVARELLETHVADRAIFLGDYVDDWQANPPAYSIFLGALFDFVDDFPDTVLLWGNHDYSYVHDLGCSGHHPGLTTTITRYFAEIGELCPFRVAYYWEGYLFSHAGVTQQFIRSHPKLKQTVECSLSWGIDYLNSVIADRPTLMWQNNSPLWARPGQNLDFDIDEVVQVVGHTPVSQVEDKAGTIYTDTWSTRSDGSPIGDKGLLIIEVEDD